MKSVQRKVIAKDQQIPQGTRYVVKERMLYTTKEVLIKGTVSFFGQYLEPGDELVLKGYYWSGEQGGGQYLVFEVVTGKAKGKEVGVYTREEFENLKRVAKKNL